MRPRTLVILALATLFFAIGAVVVNSRNPAYTSASGGELVFPDLEKKINDAAKIVVQTAAHKFTVERKGDGWAVAEKYDYPAKFEVVKSTLVGLAQLKTVEAKTSEPSLYSRLEVDDPTKKGAKGALVTVDSASGDKLASLIIGKNRYGRGGEGANMIYVRQPEDAQSWLAEGTLERTDDVNGWLQRELVKLDRNRVRQVTVTPGPGAAADDKPFTIKKDKPGEGDFTLEGVPAEDKVKSSYDVNAIAGDLALLMLEDVLPAKDLKPDAKLLRTLEYRSFDGLVVTLALYRQDGKTWAKLDAAYDAAAAPNEAAKKDGDAAKKDSGDAAKKDAGADSAAKPAGDAAKAKSADDPKKQAETIQARTKGWVYGLGASDLSTIEKKFADLIEPKAKPKS